MPDASVARSAAAAYERSTAGLSPQTGLPRQGLLHRRWRHSGMARSAGRGIGPAPVMSGQCAQIPGLRAESVPRNHSILPPEGSKKMSKKVCGFDTRPREMSPPLALY